MRGRTVQGFTLMELMMTVAIVAILAAVALPSYQQYVRKSRRAEAMATLLDMQLQQEKFRANNTTYAATAGLTIPASSHYVFTVEDNAATTYTLKAVATTTGAQDTDSQQGTSCATLTLNQSGTKTQSVCWR